MPLYDVEYVTPLTYAQQEQLANAFTAAHAKRFNTPRFFVNVRYIDIVFRGGVRRNYNRVILRTGAGSNRTNDVYLEHCRQIVEEWKRVVGREGEQGLRTVWALEAVTAALEAGIGRPKTDEEDEWVQANMVQFQELAAAGDEDYIELLRELDGREAD
ncbi:uncharacterized protein LY79DRAFT_593117 [Colletotrichum navitas]|uniref:Tautomerase cis-CaaD-like domain-containing protein n=1 Tax=Colletotrichum navitas TaxID=681940 RepID=A0AAD8PQZ5_9PEZI|nr:uncharacterized protein LY79DRAFT_593117 [Colletotrichum navitas]KAK1574780.1 hypothetical protein LY79DRAFT_593117 [Colletotrichum navitas]